MGPATRAVAIYAGIEPEDFLHLFPPLERSGAAAAYHLSVSVTVITTYSMVNAPIFPLSERASTWAG